MRIILNLVFRSFPMHCPPPIFICESAPLHLLWVFLLTCSSAFLLLAPPRSSCRLVSMLVCELREFRARFGGQLPSPSPQIASSLPPPRPGRLGGPCPAATRLSSTFSESPWETRHLKLQRLILKSWKIIELSHLWHPKEPYNFNTIYIYILYIFEKLPNCYV